MLAKYDPVKSRGYWLKFGLKFEAEFDPDPVPARARPSYAGQKANSMVDAYLIGLAKECDRPWRRSSDGWRLSLRA